MTRRPAPLPLPRPVTAPIIALALAEDLGRAGDATTAATIPPGTQASGVFRAREAGRLSGVGVAAHVLEQLGGEARFTPALQDGAVLEPGSEIASIEGDAATILMAERVMLNFLGRLSGIATLASHYVAAVEGTGARIVSTRKTTPGHRALEKHAVRCGGAVAHRLGLDDAILIKDNHIAACGSIVDAVKRAKAAAGHLQTVEIEVDTLAQLEAVLPLEPDAVLLDNMAPVTLRQAVALAREAAEGGVARCILEASGGITLDTVRGVAETGVDAISVGALTHSARSLDLGLDFDS